jgi:hypothetical protein
MKQGRIFFYRPAHNRNGIRDYTGLTPYLALLKCSYSLGVQANGLYGCKLMEKK